jgi:hypothetical protein
MLPILWERAVIWFDAEPMVPVQSRVSCDVEGEHTKHLAFKKKWTSLNGRSGGIEEE